MIGACEICDRQNVPVSPGTAAGIEVTACYLCKGDTDHDPYGEQVDAQRSTPRMIVVGDHTPERSVA